MIRWLMAVVVVAVMSLVVASAAGINVPGGTAATGSGDVVSPPLSVTSSQLVPDTAVITKLDFVEVCMDRLFVGSDPEDTTPGTTEHFDLYVQLKDAAGSGLGTPRVVHDFANGINGAPKCDDVSFFEEAIDIADIETIAYTICGRHESGDGDFHCKTPP